MDAKADSRVSDRIYRRMHTREKVEPFENQANDVVEKIREGLIHNAKVKRAYYRTLKREEKAGALPTVEFPEAQEVCLLE